MQSSSENDKYRSCGIVAFRLSFAIGQHSHKLKSRVPFKLKAVDMVKQPVLNDFLLKDGSKIVISSFTGTVVNNSSGTALRSCRLRDSEGKEQEFTFTNVGLAYKNGHCLTVVRAGVDGSGYRPEVVVYQPTTNKFWSAFPNEPVKVAKSAGVIKNDGIIKLVIFGALLVSLIGIPIAIIMIIYDMIMNNGKAKAFQEKCESYARDNKDKYQDQANELMQDTKISA